MDRRYLIERDQFPLKAWWQEAHRLRDQAGGSLESKRELQLIFGMLNAITYADNANPNFKPVPYHTEMITLGPERLSVRNATIYLHPCQRLMMNTSTRHLQHNEKDESTMCSYCFSCPLKKPAPHLSVSFFDGDAIYEYWRTNGAGDYLLRQVIDQVCRHCTLLDPDLNLLNPEIKYKEENDHV